VENASYHSAVQLQVRPGPICHQLGYTFAINKVIKLKPKAGLNDKSTSFLNKPFHDSTFEKDVCTFSESLPTCESFVIPCDFLVIMLSTDEPGALELSAVPQHC